MDVAVRTQGPKSLPAEMLYGGYDGLRRLRGNNEVVQQRGIRGLGLTADEWAAILQSSTQATLPMIIAQNPGTYYTTNPTTGAITVYSQPTGSTQNLPVGTIPAGPGASGSIQTSVGTASFGGIDTTALLIGGALILFLFMQQRRG